MPEILDEKELQLLPTKKFYDQLDNAENKCQGYAFYNEARSILNYYKELQDVSDKILKGLCYVYRNNFPKESDNDICNFSYFWLGDILYNKINPWFLFDSVISKLFIILRNHKVKDCTALNYNNINGGKYFKNIKLFFDYSKDYDIYMNQITSDNLTCNNNYNKYLQKYVETYKKVQSECQNKSPPGYCNVFNKYFGEKNSERLSNWTCKIQDNKPEEQQVQGETKEMQERSLQEPGMKGKVLTLPKELEGETESGAERHSSPVHSSSEGTLVLSSFSNSGDVPSISTTTKSITTAVAAAGLLVPPFLVYNFTPVRSWINKLLGRNQIYRNPLRERELIENSYKPYHLDSERNKYNISYRPE